MILLLHGTGSGYVEGMSLRSAEGGGGKKVDLNAAALSSFDVALLIVGMYRGISIESMYFFRVHIVFSSAFSSEGNFDSIEFEYSNIRCQIMDLSNHTS